MKIWWTLWFICKYFHWWECCGLYDSFVPQISGSKTMLDGLYTWQISFYMLHFMTCCGAARQFFGNMVLLWNISLFYDGCTKIGLNNGWCSDVFGLQYFIKWDITHTLDFTLLGSQFLVFTLLYNFTSKWTSQFCPFRGLILTGFPVN